MPDKRRPAASVPWMNMAMLGVECQQVIWLRLMKLAVGGPHAETESNLMISEKMAAAADARKMLMFGASTDSVVKGYRKVVRANIRRLSK
jgi:hypothetical protein